MKPSTTLLGIVLSVAVCCARAQVPAGFSGPIGAPAPVAETGTTTSQAAAAVETADSTKDKNAQTRAMLAEICAAADRIAERYGNLPYCHIITNDVARATALRERVQAMGSCQRLHSQEQELQAKVSELSVQVAAAEKQLAQLQAAIAQTQAQVLPPVLETPTNIPKVAREPKRHKEKGYQ